MTTRKPELLAPAGDFERLKVAIAYGADAIYMGGTSFGLRAKATNFSLEELKEAIAFAHKFGKKVYITANIFAHNNDLDEVSEYFKILEQIGADALIISDPGILMIAKDVVPDMEIHISTQANNTNYGSALFWQKQGAKRVVLARELSFVEIETIHNKAPMVSLEAFVHGAMCISYSGRCLLSNYLANRDGNKGECVNTCRFKYNLVEEKRPGEYMPVVEDEQGTYIFNSKDLCMVEYIPELVKSGITSFKIEGRMKTAYYVGGTVKVYREAIDDFFSDKALYERKKSYYVEELTKISHRGYTTGFYLGKPTGNEQIYDNSSYIRNYNFVGIVLDYDNDFKIATIEQRNKFVLGDELEVLSRSGNNFLIKVDEMYDEKLNTIESAPNPKQIIKLRISTRVQKFDMLRKKTKD